MRCKCCNHQMKSSEIIWYAELETHEELCNNCKSFFYDEYAFQGGNLEKLGSLDFALKSGTEEDTEEG